MYPGDGEDQPDPDEETRTTLKSRMGELAAPLITRVNEIRENATQEQAIAKGKSYVEQLRLFMAQDFEKFVFFSLWLTINIILWIEHAIVNWNKPNFYVTIARGFGQTLNFNCALILLPVCRNLLTMLRQTALHYFVPFDSNITFHRRIAWAIAYATAGHGVAHYLNYNSNLNPYALAWSTLAGVTGNLLTLIMVMMYTTAIDSIRRRYFNVFFFVHHLFVVFYILLLLHGPNFWIWFIVPGLVYLIERIVREYRGKQTTEVASIIKHPSDVVEIRMRKKKFKYKSGQYVFLNCPQLSFYEWHPFTISSSPDEDFVSCHIRAVGKWTKGLREYIAPPEEGELVLGKVRDPGGKRIIRMDGPFGAATEEVFQYKTVMLIGAGIGVTPFASVLKSIYHKKSTNQNTKLEKIYFYWLCRETRAFEWFQHVLRDIEIQMRERGEDFLSINVYLTQGKPSEQESEDGLDPLTALESLTNYGRPNWEKIFSDIRERHVATKVGVFMCGPRPLAKELRNHSMQQSAKKKAEGAKFIFNKENF